MITQEQKEAIQTPNEHKLIVSLAGSGKTFTFVSLAETILKTYPSSRVLLMTFTNAAAGEIGERLKKRLDKKSYLRAKSATYASLMMQQFKPLKKGRRCIIGAEQYSFLKRAASAVRYDLAEGQLNDLMVLTESLGREIDSEIKHDHNAILTDYHLIYLKYCEILRSNNCYDINMMSRELIFAIREGLVKPYPHENILCDEFQDSDSLQYLWLREHGLAGAKIACVADDDQSIYNFRGGLGYKAFLQFQEDFDPNLYYLSKTFRCAKKILSSAKGFIENNQDRMQKAMESAVEDEGKVFKVEIPACFLSSQALTEKTRDKIEVDTGKDKEDEEKVSEVEHYRFVAEKIKESEKYGWAVLARTNRQLDLIERALSEYELPVIRVGGKSIFDNIHAISMVNLFYGLINDKASSELVSGLSWASEENEVILAHISKVSQAMGFSAVSQIGDMEWSKVTAYLQELSQLAKMCNESHAVRFIEKWDSTIKRIIFNQNDKERKLQKTVLDIIIKILKGSSGDLAERAAYLVKKTKRQQKNKADNDDEGVIVLATMNSSKGLEWPRVWIIDMEDGLVPSLKGDVSIEAIEEERRLVYVAMTRAEKELYISWREGKESMFIEEIEGVLGGI